MENLESVSKSQLILSRRIMQRHVLSSVVTHTDTLNELTVITYKHTGVYMHERQTDQHLYSQMVACFSLFKSQFYFTFTVCSLFIYIFCTARKSIMSYKSVKRAAV